MTGKGQVMSICENVWIVCSILTIAFIEAGLSGRND